MFFLYHQEIGFVKENLARVKKTSCFRKHKQTLIYQVLGLKLMSLRILTVSPLCAITKNPHL